MKEFRAGGKKALKKAGRGHNWKPRSRLGWENTPAAFAPKWRGTGKQAIKGVGGAG